MHVTSEHFLYLHVDSNLRIYHGRVEGRQTVPLDYTRVIDHADLSCIGIGTPSHYLDCVPSDQNLAPDLEWYKSNGIQRFPVRVGLATIEDKVFVVKRLYFAPNSDVRDSDYKKYTCLITTTGEILSINVTGGNH